MTRATVGQVSPSVIVGALLLLAAFTIPSAAQRVDRDLPTGTRVRILAPAVGVPWKATAIVDSVGSDTLYVRSLSEPPRLRSAPRVSIPLGSIQSLDVSTGRASRIARAGRGALWGLAVYAIFASAYIAREKATCRGPDCFGEGMAWIGLAGGVLWSAEAGAAIGAALPVERWHRVTLDGNR